MINATVHDKTKNTQLEFFVENYTIACRNPRCSKYHTEVHFAIVDNDQHLYCHECSYILKEIKKTEIKNGSTRI